MANSIKEYVKEQNQKLQACNHDTEKLEKFLSLFPISAFRVTDPLSAIDEQNRQNFINAKGSKRFKSQKIRIAYSPDRTQNGEPFLDVSAYIYGDTGLAYTTATAIKQQLPNTDDARTNGACVYLVSTGESVSQTKSVGKAKRLIEVLDNTGIDFKGTISSIDYDTATILNRLITSLSDAYFAGYRNYFLK